MTNPTTPFSWQMPTSTDLVTDLPADFETFGQAVATSMADLLGGTTGQVLSKASNTDMDFTWVAQDDSNAIQNAIVDAKGDLITATAADTPARLAVGTNGQTLVADSSTATGLKWATPAGGGGKVLQVVSAVYNTKTDSTTSSYIDTGLTATITPTLATSTIVVAWGIDWRKDSANAANAVNMKLLRGATAIVTSYSLGYTGSAINNIGTWAGSYKDSPATTSATTYKVQFNSDNGTGTVSSIPYGANSLGSIVLMEIGA